MYPRSVHRAGEPAYNATVVIPTKGAAYNATVVIPTRGAAYNSRLALPNSGGGQLWLRCSSTRRACLQKNTGRSIKLARPERLQASVTTYATPLGT